MNIIDGARGGSPGGTCAGGSGCRFLAGSWRTSGADILWRGWLTASGSMLAVFYYSGYFGRTETGAVLFGPESLTDSSLCQL